MSESDQKTTYLALTIGPILKTLMQARRTRELWACSFLLSSTMRLLLARLDPNGDRVIIPCIPEEVLQKPLYGAGIYPDRLFMKADDLTEDEVQNKITEALKDLAQEMTHKKLSKDEKTKSASFWNQFLRIRYVLLPLENIQNGKLSLEMTPYLCTQELEDTCFPQEPTSNDLESFFRPDNFFNTPLVNHYLKASSQKGIYDPILQPSNVFPSTSEIAAFELFAHKEIGSEVFAIAQNHYEDREVRHEDFYVALETNALTGKHLRPRHKYFCIVHADGDNIGKAIQKLDDEENYRTFSQTLASFGADAADRINQYGGKPIYIGGDDLLFLAPVTSTGNRTIFDLFLELDKIFPVKDLHEEASLSFGLNIVYYKFPLFEAIGQAYGILQQAKEYETADGKKKNAVSFQFTKHSGSSFSGVCSKVYLNKLSSAVKVFQKSNLRSGEEKAIVSSLVYKLMALDGLLLGVANQIEKLQEKKDLESGAAAMDLDSRLISIMDHFFNEWKDHQFDEQKGEVIQLLKASYQESMDKAAWMKLFYAVMRLLQFMISPSENQPHDPENIAATAG